MGFVVQVQAYLVFTTNYFPWLTIIVIFPISAGSLIFFLPHRGNKVTRWYTLCICSLELLLMAYAFYYHFQLDDPLIQLVETYKWIHRFPFYWRLGIDGLSLRPVLLTGFITALTTLAAWPVTRTPRFFYPCVWGEEPHVFSYKISFVHCAKLPLSINRSSWYRIIWFQRTNIPF